MAKDTKLRKMHISLDVELAKRAEERAGVEDVSMSQLVRKALRRLLATPVT